MSDFLQNIAVKNLLSRNFPGAAPLSHALCALFAAVLLFSLPPGALAAKSPSAETAAEKITVNFVDVNITTLVKFISDSTGKNFVYDERLRGKVTIIAPTPLDKDEALDLFISLLTLKGFAVVQSAGAYKIVPSSMVKQSAFEVETKERSASVNENYIARLIPLKYAKSFDIMPLLKPLTSSDGYLSAFGQSNSILVLDTSMNIEKLLKIVALVDIESKEYLPEIIFLKHADAEGVLRILKEGVSSVAVGRPRKGAPSRIGGNQVKFIADERLNAVIVFGSPADIAKYRELVSILDVPSMSSSSRINVYYLENADATELAGTLNSLLGETAGSVKVNASGAAGKVVARPTELTGKIAITPDTTTNSLIIMASPESFSALKRVIEKLDRRPRQVFVEAMILEVKIQEALSLGMKWRASGTQNGDSVIVGGVGTVSSTDVASILTGLAGFSIGGMGNIVNIPVTDLTGTTTNMSAAGYAALFSLSQFNDTVDVLSTPHILTSDNKEAEIVVGENVPFLSSIERQATTTSQPLLQSIERKNVGITLRIKPQVSEGDYVKLEIYQEISAIAQTALAGGVEAADLITTNRSASTSVVVKDRQTVVIGGLIQNREVTIREKVPFLGDLPVLGLLFSNKSKEIRKTNLLVYLTPRIVKDFDELDKIKKDQERIFKDSVGERKKGESPAPTAIRSLTQEADKVDELAEQR